MLIRTSMRVALSYVNLACGRRGFREFTIAEAEFTEDDGGGDG